MFKLWMSSFPSINRFANSAEFQPSMSPKCLLCSKTTSRDYQPPTRFRKSLPLDVGIRWPSRLLRSPVVLCLRGVHLRPPGLEISIEKTLVSSVSYTHERVHWVNAVRKITIVKTEGVS